MSDIIKGVLGGGWSLLVGWILPAALNVAVLWFVLLPQVEGARPLRELPPQQLGLALLISTVALGLLLAGLQTPLYRLLEGYIGWLPGTVRSGPWWRSPWHTLLNWSHERQLARKHILRGRLDLLELSALERQGRLRDELRPRLDAARADARLARYADADAGLGAAQTALLAERLRRYPVDDAQVVPTRLGNAIRRLEEYGFDRFRLDSQRLWYELTAVAGDQARKDLDQARTTVDFLVGLLYGHLLVAAAALAALGAASRPWALLAIAAVLVAAAGAWYRVATVATDDWAAAVRALVNTGRKPLAEALGLRLPPTLAEERSMWSSVSRLSARPFDSRSAELDRFREPERPPCDAGG
jgi:hypothetical protein